MNQRLIGLFIVVSMMGAALPVGAQDDAGWLLAQINSLRASVGLPPYAINSQLAAAAQRQSQYLVETCNVTHVWPDGTTPTDRARQAGYGSGLISENIYAGSNADAGDAWNFWVTSPSHYNSLVHDRLSEIGIGIAHGGLCGHAYTLVFGQAGGSLPSVPPASSGGAPEREPATVPPVYVPPQPTNTPTPTIPTLTPSATWTITATFMPTTTGAPPTATGTPLVLPTVPAMQPRLSATPTPTASPEPDNTEPVAVAAVGSPVPPTPAEQGVTPAESGADEGDGFEARDLIPVALVVQIVLIGVAGFWYFRRAR